MHEGRDRYHEIELTDAIVREQVLQPLASSRREPRMDRGHIGAHVDSFHLVSLIQKAYITSPCCTVPKMCDRFEGELQRSFQHY